MSIGGHQSPVMKSDTWLTPPHVLDALGEFDLDPCTPDAMPWPTAKARFTERDDGLAQNWFGRVWLNPPYGRAAATWLDRMATHNHGTALIFARTETDMFFRQVWERASALLFLEGRLHFHHADGTRAKANSGAPSVLIAYGLHDTDVLAECDLPGAFVPLACMGQSVMVVRHDTDAITWRELLANITARQGGTVSLDVAYALIAEHPKAIANPNWRAKIRQTFNRGGFERVAPATYSHNKGKPTDDNR